jgi:hypothetical protein
MPVEIKEFAKIITINEIEREGVGVATDLIAIKGDDEEIYYGKLLAVTKVRTRITCDLGTDCTRGKIDENFVTHPYVVEFDDEGKGPGDFIKDVSQVIISSDYRGAKIVFCCAECSAKYYKKLAKHSNVIEFSAGKGKRTFEPEVKPEGSLVLESDEPSNQN